VRYSRLTVKISFGINLTDYPRWHESGNKIEVVAKASSRFNKADFQVVESKDAPEGSAPAPKTDFGAMPRTPIFMGL